MKQIRSLQNCILGLAIALAALFFTAAAVQAAPPVDPLLAVCPEGEFLHIQSGGCFPLHTTYGFDGFSEPETLIELQSCDVQELRQAVSQGNRRVLLKRGCQYDLGSTDLRIKSNTVIDGNSLYTVGASSSSSAAGQNDATTETVITCTRTTAFRIHDVTNVIIRNLTIDGLNNQQPNQGCGTLVFIDRGADNVLVERLRLINGLGKGVGFRTASRVTVRYSWVQDMWDDHGLNADKRFVDIAYYSNYITNVGTSHGKIGYGINSHATKAEIAGNYIENTDSGIKLMGARYTLLHHNTVIGASSENPLYRGVWTAIDDKDGVRPESLVYYENLIDTDGVRPFSVLDGATDIYFAGNRYGNVSKFIPISDGSSVYQCIDSTDADLEGSLIEIDHRFVTFPDSGMGEFDPCALQSVQATRSSSTLAPIILQEPENQHISEGESATLQVTATGSGPIVYQWQRRFSNGKWYSLYNGNGATYTTRPLQGYNNGNQYRVKVWSEFGGTLSRVVTLSIAPTDACVSPNAEWQNRPMRPQHGRFRATFLATPADIPMDALIGMNDGNAARFSDAAVIVRFAESGRIDVRDGLGYRADVDVAYVADETLHFRVEVDVDKGIYSVYVAPYEEGAIQGEEIEIADDFAFRSEQKTVEKLDRWSFWAGEGRLEVCDLVP